MQCERGNNFLNFTIRDELTHQKLTLFQENKFQFQKYQFKMKCIQKLCQRAKNLNGEGRCSVCEDVIKENEKKHKKVEKTKVKEVAVDLKLMVHTHEKLSRGEKVEPDIVSNLLLAGVINILDQHDTIVEAETRIKALEQEKVSNEARLEAIENWVLKQDEKIKELDDKLINMDENGVILKENKIMETLKQKVIGLEINLGTMKNIQACKKQPEKSNLREKKCEDCGETYARNCDLEHHLESCHSKEKKHECNSCGKRFHLKWRLKKHVMIHTTETKTCQYYSKQLECPYQEIGCMFLHEPNSQGEVQDDIEKEIDDAQIECNLCGCTFLDTDELEYHIEDAHRWLKNLSIN